MHLAQAHGVRVANGPACNRAMVAWNLAMNSGCERYTNVTSS